MRLGYAGSGLIQYKSNEVYYESDAGLFGAAECAGRGFVKWRVQVIMPCILQNVQLWREMTSARMAQLVPMEIICTWEKRRKKNNKNKPPKLKDHQMSSGI